MGICGSGAASIAMIAKKMGYTVSGCDLSTDSYYAGELKKAGIPISEGHSRSHLTNDIDIVAVSPALFDISPDNEELKEADKRGILMTWQEFMGKILQQGKRVIAVSGTHGKTTTTFLTAELLIEAGLDPTVEGGSVYKKWKNGGRFGGSDLFLCEADEFNRNFFHYKPETAVMTNVEMDHPECFRDLNEVEDSFAHFLANDPNLKNVVFSGESPGAWEVLRRASRAERFRECRIIALYNECEKAEPVPGVTVLSAVYHVEGHEGTDTTFSLTFEGKTSRYVCRMPGLYNVANAALSVLIAKTYQVSDLSIQTALDGFLGAGRRFDYVGDCRDVPVYDDYAHHPTEIRALLTMCREYFPGKKLLAFFEPHQISRLRLLFQDYVDALTIADHVVIMKTHIGREVLKNVTPLSKEEWESASDRICYEEDADRQKEIAWSWIDRHECDMILVIGAANSYRLSRFLTKEEEE